MRELLAKAPPPAPGLRRAVAVRPRPSGAAPPTAGRAGARGGAWTDETLLDRLRGRRRRTTLAIVDGDVRLTVDDLRARRRAVAAAAVRAAACGPATSSRGSCRTGGKPSCSAGRIWRCGAIASPITPTLARARGRLHPPPDRRAASSSCPRRSAAPTTARCCTSPASTATLIVVRDGAAPAWRGDPVPDARRRRRRRPRVDPVDVGHDLGSEGRRAHAPEPARSRPTRIAAAHDDARGRTAAPADADHARRRAHLRRAAARSRAGSPRCSWTRGSRGRALELARDASASR